MVKRSQSAQQAARRESRKRDACAPAPRSRYTRTGQTCTRGQSRGTTGILRMRPSCMPRGLSCASRPRTNYASGNGRSRPFARSCTRSRATQNATDRWGCNGTVYYASRSSYTDVSVCSGEAARNGACSACLVRAPYRRVEREIQILWRGCVHRRRASLGPSPPRIRPSPVA